MADQKLDVRGWPVAEVEPEEQNFSGRSQPGGRLFLFRTRDDWTLLSVRYVTRWGDEHPEDGWGVVHADAYHDLAALRAGLDREGRSTDWWALVSAGSENDAELKALWTPVQIDRDLERSSVHRGDLGARGERRQDRGWQEDALALAVARLEELGFIVLEATTEYHRIFRQRLPRAWRECGNPVIGAAVAARYGYRADLVVAIDGAGEIYVRTADGGFDPGAHRRYPPRPLTRSESGRVEEIHRRRREEARRLDAGLG